MNRLQGRQPLWLRCLIAVLIVLAAVATRLMLLEPLGGRSPFLTFYPAVMFAALLGGLLSGLLATILCGIFASYFLMEPVGHFHVAKDIDLLALSLFLMAGAIMSWVSEAMRLARLRASRAEAQARIAAEREAAAAALQESETLFRATFEQTAVGMAQTSLDGRFLRVNTTFCKMLGYSSDELSHLSLQNIVLPEDLSMEFALIRQLLDGDIDSYFLSRRCLRKDGSLIWSDVTASLVRDPAGQPDYLIQAKVDITGRKLAEEALRESEKNLALAQSLTHVGNWTWTPRDDTVTWSDETYRIFGVNKDAFIPSLESVTKMIHPEDLPRQQEWLKHSLTEERLEPIEIRIIRPDGEIRHLQAIAEKMSPDDAPGQQRVFGTVIDITDRKLLEEQLREAKETAERRAEEAHRAHRLLSFHLDNAPLAVMERDKGLRIVNWSKGAERIFGWKAEEVLGRTPLDLGLVFEDDLPQVRQRFKKMVEGPEKRQSGSNRNIRKDGTVISCDWHNSVLLDEDGRIASVLSIAQDVTWRVQAEEALKAAKEEADKANKAKSQFLANMSHEIRTPMNGIMGMTELALLTCQDPKSQEYLKLAKQSGKALLDIINDILDLSRIEAGRIELERVPFSLHDTVDELLKSLNISAQAKGLTLLYAIETDVPEMLLGDKGRLRQILTNIIGNAIKFTNQGSVALSVEVEEKPSDTTVLLWFSVSDTGIGIPADKAFSIFESFTQAGGSAHARYGGTGLGLSITKALVEKMGGRLWMRSEEGRGSTFFFTALFDLAAMRQEPEIPASPPEARLAAKLKILLAEDNFVNRFLAVNLLEREGHAVVTAENGREALEKLRQEPFDVVLMDVRMPVMDGEEATSRIRSGEAGKSDIPIVALTAHALKGDRERFLLAGMNDYLAKPLVPEELRQVLSRVMEEASGGREA